MLFINCLVFTINEFSILHVLPEADLGMFAARQQHNIIWHAGTSLWHSVTFEGLLCSTTDFRI